MPKLLFARPPVDAVEERRIRKLAGARHAPADWIRRAQVIALSWEGLRVPAIAAALGCSQKAVRYRLARFAAEGLDGLGDRPGAGRKPRIGQDQRSRLIALARSTPPGRLVRAGAGELGAGGATGPRRRRRAERRRARRAGGVDPGCVDRRGPRGRHRDRPLPGAPDPAGRRGALAASPLVDQQRRSGVRPKRTRVVELYTHPPAQTTVIAADELGPVMPRTFDPPPSWSPDGHRIKAPLTYSRGPEKTWIYGGVRIGDGQAVTLCAPSRNSASWQRFLARLEQANPTGTIAMITGNLSSHHSLATQVSCWTAARPAAPCRDRSVPIQSPGRAWGAKGVRVLSTVSRRSTAASKSCPPAAIHSGGVRDVSLSAPDPADDRRFGGGLAAAAGSAWPCHRVCLSRGHGAGRVIRHREKMTCGGTPQ